MAQTLSDEPRAAILSVHTSPIDQPGTGDSGGMNVYIRSVATRLEQRGVDVDLFTRCRGGVDHETKHLTKHAHDGASAARDETLERGGEGRVPNRVGQIDHRTLEDRPQSPLPPAVVGDEPHIKGAEAYAPTGAESRIETSGVGPTPGQAYPWAVLWRTG